LGSALKTLRQTAWMRSLAHRECTEPTNQNRGTMERQMQTESHPLAPFFQQVVRNSYSGKLGIHDATINNYIASLLCEFSESDKLYKVRDEQGKPIHALEEMVQASDPIHGTAASFDAERAVRKHIGDYALFVSGMYPESMDPYKRRLGQQSYDELVSVGKQSYYIVSQFDLEEYADEAPMFRKLSGWFDRCIYGLRLVREELTQNKPGCLPARVN
jgi:hypothetical protein